MGRLWAGRGRIWWSVRERQVYPYIPTCGYVWIKYGQVWVVVVTTVSDLVTEPGNTIRVIIPLVITVNVLKLTLK